MKKTDWLFYLVLFGMLLILPTFLIATNPITTTGWVFTEKRTGFSIYKDQYFRFDSSETFFLENFETNVQNGTVTLNVLRDGTDGDVQSIIQPYKRANFIFYFVKNETLPISFDVVPLLVRDNTNLDNYPFNSTETKFMNDIICEQSSCRFNLDREVDFFNFNFEFLQTATLNGQPTNLTVNVELNTNNLENGLIERTAVHIIKRDENQNIVYREDYSIQMVSQISRYLRVLDNESLQIPYLFLGLWVLARVYMNAINYLETNKIKLWYRVPSETEEKET